MSQQRRDEIMRELDFYRDEREKRPLSENEKEYVRGLFFELLLIDKGERF
jgi:hypothetical protein